ncbi:MAG: hypothetical protein F4X17_16415 [Gemmatimonadetes bacterium]|nr:hypothetical protein [Gemmatimonadota bacterium]
MLANIGHRLGLHNLVLLVFIPSLWACAPEGQHVVVDRSAGPWPDVQIDGVLYHKAAGKATATAQQGGLSIELSYALRDGQAYVDAVRIDGVEYRADCPDVTAATSADCPQIEEGGSSAPYVEYCEDGVGVRDVDFTCDKWRNLPGSDTPGPEDVRFKVEGNEDVLRAGFETAFVIDIGIPAAPHEGYSPPSEPGTYLLSADPDYFYLEVKYRAKYWIHSDGPSDTWGDLYLDDNDSIKPIAGTGDGVTTIVDGREFTDNFSFEMVLEPGDYYLRVVPEKEGDTGTYSIRVAAWFVQ